MCMNCWYPLTHHLYLHHSGLKFLNCSWCVWCLHCEPSPPSTSSSLPLLHVCPPLHRLSLCIHHLFVISLEFLSSFCLSTFIFPLPPFSSPPLSHFFLHLSPSLSTLVLMSFLHHCPHSYPCLPLFRPSQPWQPAVVSCPSRASRGQRVTCFWADLGVQLSPLLSASPSSSTAPPSSPWWPVPWRQPPRKPWDW